MARDCGQPAAMSMSEELLCRRWVAFPKVCESFLRNRTILGGVPPGPGAEGEIMQETSWPSEWLVPTRNRGRPASKDHERTQETISQLADLDDG